jgi:glycosyltransferase involved in cell wall biosynthesis
MGTDLAIFMATSGHSGVDRLVHNMLPVLASRGYRVDLLKVGGHGPHLREVPEGVRVIALGSKHVYTSLPAVMGYLRRERPLSLLCDKDRVNHTAILARALAQPKSGSRTFLAVRTGTTLSIDSAQRGWFHAAKTRFSTARLYPFADRVIVNCQAVAEDMARYTGLDRTLIDVVPSPVVPSSAFKGCFSQPDHPWLRDGGPPVVMGVGELCARKDFATLLRAVALMQRDHPCRLMILGRGKHRDKLVELAGELGIAERLALPGFVPSPLDYLAKASLFAFTSTLEGLPFALIEALAVGVPAVSTDCPSGPREILQDGKYGPLVPVGDHRALAAAMLATLHNPLPRAFLQEAARPYEIEGATSAYVKALALPSPCPAGEG